VSVPFDNLVVRGMADVLLKEAMGQPMQPQQPAQQPGKMEKYLPWYGAAGAGAAGHEIGKRLVPGKYRALGAIGGTLLGTALGVHGGEALGKRLDRPKIAKVLTQAGRERVKEKNFAIPKGEGPGGTGKYPIHDTRHAKSALTYVEQHGTPAEKGKVYAAVAKKYPGLSARSSVPEVAEKAKEKKAAKEKKPPHPGVTLAKSMLGFGTGMGLGYLGTKGVDKLMRLQGGQGLPKSLAVKALPIVTGLGGLAYTQMQNKTLGKMREDHLERQEMKRGGQST
jgi:hypothetical protein